MKTGTLRNLSQRDTPPGTGARADRFGACRLPGEGLAIAGSERARRSSRGRAFWRVVRCAQRPPMTARRRPLMTARSRRRAGNSGGAGIAVAASADGGHCLVPDKPGPGRERVLEPVCSEGVLQLLDELGFTPPKVSAIPAHQLDGGFPLRHRARPLPRRGCLPPTPAGRTPPGRGSPWVLSASRLMVRPSLSNFRASSS